MKWNNFTPSKIIISGELGLSRFVITGLLCIPVKMSTDNYWQREKQLHPSIHFLIDGWNNGSKKQVSLPFKGVLMIGAVNQDVHQPKLNMQEQPFWGPFCPSLLLAFFFPLSLSLSSCYRYNPCVFGGFHGQPWAAFSTVFAVKRSPKKGSSFIRMTAKKASKRPLESGKSLTEKERKAEKRELSFSVEGSLPSNISILKTVKSGNYESRNNAMSRKFDRIIDYPVMEVSIEKSRYDDKFHYLDGFSADWGLS